MKRLLQIALGILSAIGGFVDIGDLVFNTQAGATFGYQLIWVVVVGVVGIIVYSEMCGRVSAVSGRPVFDLVRERAGFAAGARDADRREIVNLMTCAAEVGGVAICFQLLSGLAYRLLIPLAVVGARRHLLGAAVRAGSSASSATRPRPARLRGRRDQAPPRLGRGRRTASCPAPRGGSLLVYLYFVVGLLGAAMTPYEVYFYSSGAVEDGWSVEDLGPNKRHGDRSATRWAACSRSR